MKAIHSAGLKKQTKNRFLNMYEIDAIRRDGTHAPYYFASRRKDGDLMYETKELRADGVVIYPILREQPDKLVVLRQFRYPVNDYIFELPAGLVDAGEDPMKAAARELKEETGYTLIPYTDYDLSLMRPRVQNQGMSDECDITVFGYAEGEMSLEGNEGSEDIQVVLADKQEVRRILREELVSIRGAYLMTAFLGSNPDKPFDFLKILY